LASEINVGRRRQLSLHTWQRSGIQRGRLHQRMMFRSRVDVRTYASDCAFGGFDFGDAKSPRLFQSRESVREQQFCGLIRRH